MRQVIHISRKPALSLRMWEMDIIRSAVLMGTPTYTVASSRAQAEKTFGVTLSVLNGRDPKATPG